MTRPVQLQQMQEEGRSAIQVAVLVLHDRGQYVPLQAVDELHREPVLLCEWAPYLLSKRRHASPLGLDCDLVPVFEATTPKARQAMVLLVVQENRQRVTSFERGVLPSLVQTSSLSIRP